MSKRICTLDLETDPFKHGETIEPFCSGFYDGSRFACTWDEGRTIERTVKFLEKEEPAIIYMHNGGRFDFYYFLHLFEAELQIVNGRIIRAKLGAHEFRDSFSILPFALREYQKKEIDYKKLQRKVRHKHRDEIIEYLRYDCLYLHELVTAYWDEFGDVLTIGSAAMRQLKSFHKFKSGGPEYDARFRKKFYFGGRVQVFRPGIIREPINVYDVNSMYPAVMRDYLHPINTGVSVSKRIEKDTCFIVAEGWQRGPIKPFIIRGEDKLNYDTTYGTFGTTIHEWNAALETNSFQPKKIHITYGWSERSSFGDFVDHFYNARLEAKRTDDRVHELFYKFVLNSSYGKFAQNPENYFEWTITPMDPLPEPWEPAAIAQGKYILWRKPVIELRFYNIATAASITGAARSVLLRGLHAVKGLAYCDTDSIFAASSGSLRIDDSSLGAWKHEARATHSAFAGRKLYALCEAQSEHPAHCKQIKKGEKCTHENFKHEGRRWTCIKQGTKGNRITAWQTFRVTNGKTVKWLNQSPTFKLDGSVQYLSREVSATW